jgi:hypothetical protein
MDKQSSKTNSPVLPMVYQKIKEFAEGLEVF